MLPRVVGDTENFDGIPPDSERYSHIASGLSH
jgi:hypothetical protein